MSAVVQIDLLEPLYCNVRSQEKLHRTLVDEPIDLFGCESPHEKLCSTCHLIFEAPVPVEWCGFLINLPDSSDMTWHCRLTFAGVLFATLLKDFPCLKAT